MTKRTRTILFWICLFLFLLIAPSAVFYSQGYRIDFEAKKFTQTGAFYFKIWPKSVEIYIDGKLAKKTDFFFGSVLIENLLPKKYTVEIKKPALPTQDEYYSWQKNLDIKEKQVTEAKNIVLIPKEPNFTILTKGVEDFFFSPDQKKIIFKTTTHPPPSEEEKWALKLYDLERNVKSHLIEEEDISKARAELFALEFSPDSKKIFLEVGLKEQLKHFLLEIDKTPLVLTETEKSLPFLGDVVTYQTIGQDKYLLDNFGHLFKNEEKLTEKPFSVKKETAYSLEIFQNFIFLRESQTLYQLNPISKSFDKISEPVKDLAISPDLKKLAFFNNYEIWILFLDSDPQTSHRKGDQVFLTRFSDKIEQIFWYTSHYLIFNVGNKIKVAEIDDRDRINIVDLAEFEKPKIFWNKFYNEAEPRYIDFYFSSRYKKLFILSGGDLYNSESLLP